MMSIVLSGLLKTYFSENRITSEDQIREGYREKPTKVKHKSSHTKKQIEGHFIFDMYVQ